MPDFSRRAREVELMDDLSLPDEAVSPALEGLRRVNRLLGGYAAVRAGLEPLVRSAAARGTRLRLLDVGSGAADVPEDLVRWGARRGVRIEVVALDLAPAVIESARRSLDRRLPAALRGFVRLERGDALHLPYRDGEFDAALSNLFMHHLDAAEAVVHLREQARVSRSGILVTDLHRHAAAWLAFRAVAPLLSPSRVFRHDCALSVRRAITRRDLEDLARRAGLSSARVRWHWAFRWSLSTIDPAREGGRA